MAMFPMRRPRGIVPFMDEELTQGGDATKSDAPRMPEQRRRGGLFGGPARGILRREDGDPGTFANYALFGINGVRGMRDDRMRRDLFGQQVRGLKMEEARGEQQMMQGQQREQMVEQFISSLPPEQQVRARLAYSVDPDGFAEQYLSTGSNDWQNNGTIPYRIDPATGQVITGSGTIPHRPRQPLIQYGAAGDEADWEYGE